jgi:hypothetical protein
MSGTTKMKNAKMQVLMRSEQRVDRRKEKRTMIEVF